jgi:hypothetical protein
MCFVNDPSRRNLPPACRMADGSIDFEHYKRLAQLERTKAAGEAFRAIVAWLHRGFSADVFRNGSERLG